MKWQTVYPRPQWKRDSFYSLNGAWNCNGTEILVPFPPESKASTFKGKRKEVYLYEKKFLYTPKPGMKVLLHFDAVDQIASVRLNGKLLGFHEGGYLPFTFDITSVVTEEENILTVKCKDTIDRDYPYGKQCRIPHGMWYTPVSGIWKSVWIEEVSRDGLLDARIDTSLTGIKASFQTDADSYWITIYDHEQKLLFRKEYFEKKIEIDFKKEQIPIHLWSTEDPYLYPMVVETKMDRVESYFALRTIEMKCDHEKKQLLLNGKPIFLHGILHQGYYTDGIYLPSSPTEYEKDVMRLKNLGFNMIRMHLKVENSLFYEACDRLGMLVMQDMVNSGTYRFFRDTIWPTVGFSHMSDHTKGDIKRKKFFIRHCIKTCKVLHNYPCIIGFTIFNEGWGQFDADFLYTLVKKRESARLIDATSGWFVQKKSDFDSYHIYLRNKIIKSKKRPALLSECGGYTRVIKGHLYHPNIRYGYGHVKKNKDLTGRIEEMYKKMVFPSLQYGLCGCVYTQFCDVETEINGLYTYDREICKVDPERMRKLADYLKLE